MLGCGPERKGFLHRVGAMILPAPPGARAQSGVRGLWARAAPRSANLRCASWARTSRSRSATSPTEHVHAVVNAANTVAAGRRGRRRRDPPGRRPRAARGLPRARRLRLRRRQGHPGLRAPRPLRDPHRRARSGAAATPARPGSCRAATAAASRSPTSSAPTSVAFPAISTGAYGYPVREATQIAVDTVRSTHHQRELVRFVCFDAAVHELYEREIALTLPRPRRSAGAATLALVLEEVDEHVVAEACRRW